MDSKRPDVAPAPDDATLAALIDAARHRPQPRPWEDADNIPWWDPDFSRRMLDEHLSQDHDAASRRVEVIDRQVRWIHDLVPGDGAGRVLDLGCGPGLYSHRLAALGHECVGVDYSPASIRYAAAEAERHQLSCRFVLDDVRSARFGEGFDLAMMLFGEVNTLRPRDASHLLSRVRRALQPAGVLLMEVHDARTVRELGTSGRSWYVSERDVFGDIPHLVLDEWWWDHTAQAAVRRIDVAIRGGTIDRYAQTLQGYDPAGYRDLLTEAGFAEPEAHQQPAGEPGTEGLVMLVAGVLSRGAPPQPPGGSLPTGPDAPPRAAPDGAAPTRE